VWFMTPFKNTYPEYHGKHIDMIDAYEIRKTLGDFSGVANQPAKYAARMAQAFTATDPSVKIRRDQWEEVPDLGQKPYLHTDGMILRIDGSTVDSLGRTQASAPSHSSLPMRSGSRCARMRRTLRSGRSSRQRSRSGTWCGRTFSGRSHLVRQLPRIQGYGRNR
jgi:hypothetical protein